MDDIQINPPPTPTTPTQAPWTDVQKLIKMMTTLIGVYEARGLVPSAQTLIQLEESGGVTEYAAGLTQVAVSVDSQIKTPWMYDQEPTQILKASPRDTETIKSTMYYWGGGKRLLIWADSTLDKDVELQVRGNIRNNIDRAAEVGPALPCYANGVANICPDWDDWHPYIGVEVLLTSAPTEGIITIEVAEQN